MHDVRLNEHTFGGWFWKELSDESVIALERLGLNDTSCGVLLS